jgi:DNA-binding CsgD family transcriptional regulator
MAAQLDDTALPKLCMRVLEHMSIGVVACDNDLVVLAATPTATRLLVDFTDGAATIVGAPLPEPIRQAANAYLEQSYATGRRRVNPHRVESGHDSAALYVASKRILGLRPATIAVRLHQERLADSELFEALQEKFDLSARDRRLIALLRQRHSNAVIAETLHLTLGTVKVYLHELFEKLDVHSRGELLAVLDRMRKGAR